MKFTLKTAIIGISVVLLIVLYNAFYTLALCARGAAIRKAPARLGW
jgi:hypothetical protein